MSQYFPEPKPLRGKVKFELDLSNYATKANSKFAEKVDLGNLKSNIDKLNIDKLKNVSNGLSSLKNKVDKLNIGKLESKK